MKNKKIIMIAISSLVLVVFSEKSLLAQLDTTKAEYKIESIRELSRKKDTASIHEVIAIKIKTQKSVGNLKTLFIDGLKVKGLTPWKTNETEHTVFFQLNRNVQELVLSYLQNLPEDDKVVPVYISVGDTTKNIVVRATDPIYLTVKQKISKTWVWIGSISLLIIVLIIIALANDVLKDDKNVYYSLGRTQLFYWTILFSFCYLFIWASTSSLPDLTGSALVILGISAATTASAKVIENQKHLSSTAIYKGKSAGLLMDILSDGSGVSVQRFQNIIFNLVFGMIFIQKATSALVIPSFDTNVLLLMGISSGTYAGMKITEA